MTMTDEQILEAMKPHLDRGDGCYLSDTSPEYVVAAGRALLSASKPAVPEGWTLAMIERSYDMRAKAIIAFNTAEQSGKDRDDALDAAWQAMLAASPAAPAQSSVIAAAQALIAADRAQALTTEHVNALENAIAIQRGEVALPVPAQSGEAKRFPTPISIRDDKICEIAGKYNLENLRLDALRGFVNEIIIVNEAEYAKSE